MTTNYSKGMVYKVLHISGEGPCYIGSTVQRLSQRMGEHRRRYEKYKVGDLKGSTGKLTVYELFEKNGGPENFKIELICNFPCNSIEELRKEEGNYIRELDCVNKVVPGRTKKEYYEETKDSKKEQIKEQKRKYYEANKEFVKAKAAEYRTANRDEINAQKKEHYQLNKDRILAQQKEYRDKKQTE